MQSLCLSASDSPVDVRVGANGPAVGVLKDAGHINWPLFLRGPTQQAAYFALHNAFVSYARTAESAGFHAIVAPPTGA